MSIKWYKYFLTNKCLETYELSFFEKFDAYKNGFITKSELHLMLKNLGLSFKNNEIA